MSKPYVPVCLGLYSFCKVHLAEKCEEWERCQALEEEGSRRHVGYGCHCTDIYYTITDEPSGFCPICGEQMIKAYTLTEKQLAELEETPNEG